jgi:uracil-DNA glycosylase family 4
VIGDTYVPPRGNPHARILFIGEAPGKYEVEKLKPFVGPAGNVLTELLMKAGIDPNECFYTNLTKYQPPTTYPKGGGRPKSNDLSAWIPKMVPTDERLLSGIDELITEINAVDPNVIVPLGNWPLWFLYGQKPNKQGEVTGITDYRGYVLEARKVARGRKIIPTFHPSYYLHGAYGEAGLGVMDFRKVAKEAAYPDIRRMERVYFINPQGEERETLRQRLLSEGPILFTDIERPGRSIKCVGFAVSPSWAVTIKTESRSDMEWVRSLIESGKPLGAQNATYDLGMLEWHEGIHGFEHLVYDTMVGAYVLNIEHIKNLGFLGSMYTDMPAWWDVIDWDKIHVGKQSIDELLPYNCGDNVVCCEAAEKQQIEMQADPKYREAFEFDMQKVKALWKVSRRGCPLDLTKLANLKRTVATSLKENQSQLNEIVDNLGMELRGQDFNVKSPIQVAEFLAAWLGIELTQRTPGGKLWKHDNRTLMEYARRSDSPFVRNCIERILRVREDRDTESKFLSIEWDDDGRARTILDPTKTVTRRLASKTFVITGRGSNLQNIPAPSSSPRYGGLCRGVFVPDTGLKFGYADLKGAEFLIVAWLTQDELMLKLADMSIKGTGNVHKYTAAFMFDEVHSEADVDKDSPFYFLGKKMRHCVDDKTEVLTPSGWMLISDLSNGVPIAQFWPNEQRKIDFVIPQEIQNYTCDEEVLWISGKELSQVVTKDHRLLYVDGGKRFSVKTAEDIPWTARIPIAGMYDGPGVDLSDAEIMLAVATQADGSYVGRKICFHLKKQYKIDRLIWLLKTLKIQYDASPGHNGAVKVFFPAPNSVKQFLEEKRFSSKLLELNAKQADIVLDEVTRWDGSRAGIGRIEGKQIRYNSSIKTNVEWIKTLAHLRGLQAIISEQGGPSYRLSFNRRQFTSGLDKTRTQYKGKVFCVTVPSSFFLVRRAGKISVTGNSGNYMIGWKELMGRINAEAIETGVWVDAKTVKRMIARYIEMHPGLPIWWDEERMQAKKTGQIRNLFGFIRNINDKVDNCLPDIVAFRPQSTVGDALNYGLVALESGVPLGPQLLEPTWAPKRYKEALNDYKFDILLQVHDAIGYQFDPKYEIECHSLVRELMTIPIYIPKTDRYETIPIEIQTGEAWFPLTDWHNGPSSS